MRWRVAAALVCILWMPTALAANSKPKPQLFIFGDSLLDVGTNLYIANSSSFVNFLPYGETYFHHPTGRWSNGLITSDYVARFLGLPLLPPYLQPGANFTYGANFASGGSGLLDSTNANFGLVPLNTQLRQFKELISHMGMDVQKKLSQSIAMITTGNNDITWGYLRNSTASKAYTPHQFVHILLKAYKQSIERLYEIGVRKFVISGLGPIGCTPAARLYAGLVQNTTGCFILANQMSEYFDSGLEIVIKSLTSSTTAKIIFAKPYDYLIDMINNGQKYGFSVTVNNCCGAGLYNALLPCGRPIPPNLPYKPFLCHKPSKYLFWDGHLTQKAYWYLSTALWSGNSNFVTPFNLKTLLAL